MVWRVNLGLAPPARDRCGLLGTGPWTAPLECQLHGHGCLSVLYMADVLVLGTKETLSKQLLNEGMHEWPGRTAQPPKAT